MPVVKRTTKHPHSGLGPAAPPPIPVDTPASTPGKSLAASLAAGLSRRGLAAPALLFLLGHRPLAFAAGHLLAVAAPVAAVLGATQVGSWSHLLIAPGSVDHLLAEIGAAEQQAAAPPRPGMPRP